VSRNDTKAAQPGFYLSSFHPAGQRAVLAHALFWCGIAAFVAGFVSFQKTGRKESPSERNKGA